MSLKFLKIKMKRVINIDHINLLKYKRMTLMEKLIYPLTSKLMNVKMRRNLTNNEAKY